MTASSPLVSAAIKFLASPAGRVAGVVLGGVGPRWRRKRQSNRAIRWSRASGARYLGMDVAKGRAPLAPTARRAVPELGGSEISGEPPPCSCRFRAMEVVPELPPVDAAPNVGGADSLLDELKQAAHLSALGWAEALGDAAVPPPDPSQYPNPSEYLKAHHAWHQAQGQAAAYQRGRNEEAARHREAQASGPVEVPPSGFAGRHHHHHRHHDAHHAGEAEAATPTESDEPEPPHRHHHHHPHHEGASEAPPTAAGSAEPGGGPAPIGDAGPPPDPNDSGFHGDYQRYLKAYQAWKQKQAQDTAYKQGRSQEAQRDRRKMSAQKAASQRVLASVRSSYDRRISNLSAQLSQAKNDAEKQALQAQIDSLKQQQTAAAATQQALSQRDDEHSRNLEQQLLQSAQNKPGDLTSMFSQMMQMKMMEGMMGPQGPAAAPAAPAAPSIIMAPAQAPAGPTIVNVPPPWGGPAPAAPAPAAPEPAAPAPPPPQPDAPPQQVVMVSPQDLMGGSFDPMDLLYAGNDPEAVAGFEKSIAGLDQELGSLGPRRGFRGAERARRLRRRARRLLRVGRPWTPTCMPLRARCAPWGPPTFRTGRKPGFSIGWRGMATTRKRTTSEACALQA